ncbi:MULTISPECIES: hypothetical protein [unclassified Leisingera]|uniref:hypothetical protein n=1 Tax=unclassified Leisingera TaxID=2614906 RepID=UPI001012D71C|nr:MULTISPECIES: hypothetical protein [unclassified Leisingera]MCF6433074.1 hypothetical protein [Leisingera sp. MMG026]QAX28454.1 hypothetical protein ETW24_03170 [Leisingera sp. NJS204]
MKKIVLLLPLLALAACGDEFSYPSQLEKQSQTAAQAAATPVDQITLERGASINGGNFQVLGPVKTSVGKPTAFHPAPTVADAEKKLRIEAAKLGADAVINAEVGNVGVCPLSWGCRAASGTAVKLSY